MTTEFGQGPYVDPVTLQVYADDVPSGVFQVGKPEELRWGVKNGGAVTERDELRGKTLAQLVKIGAVG